MTPLRPALISATVLILPFLLAGLAVLIAKVCGCTLTEARVDKCVVLGMDISGLLYGMFMCMWLGMFTGGLAILDLLVSGVWALPKRQPGL